MLLGSSAVDKWTVTPLNFISEYLLIRFRRQIRLGTIDLTDKKQAIKGLLEIKDSEQFLKARD